MFVKRKTRKGLPPARVPAGEMLTRVAALLACGGAYWFLSGAVLWWAYDMGPLIRGGYYSHEDALTYVREMAAVIAGLTAPVWLVRLTRNRRGHSTSKTNEESATLSNWRGTTTRTRPWRLLWGVSWRTSLVLFAYAAAVVAHVQFGTNNLDDSIFLPFPGHPTFKLALWLGELDGRFFSEVGPLSFLIGVVPTMGVASGLLYFFYEAAFRQWRSWRAGG
jgi:hypothetical protein